MTVVDLSYAAVERVLAAADAHFPTLDPPARIAVTLWAAEQLQGGLSPAALVHHLEACPPGLETGPLLARLALPVREVDHRLPARAGWLQIPHGLIADTEVSDAALGLWMVLARIPDSDRISVSPSYAWLAAQLGWTGSTAAVTKRVQRGLADAARVGLIQGQTRHTGHGRGTRVLLQRTKPATAGRSWERLPWAVVDLLRDGRIDLGLLRGWLRWLALMAGTGRTTIPASTAAAQWGASTRHVQQQRRALIEAGLLDGDRRHTKLPDSLHDQLARTTGKRHEMSTGSGTKCLVSSKTPSKTPELTSAASAASNPTRKTRTAAAGAPAGKDLSAAQVIALPRRRGGRAATAEERAAGRLLEQVPAWAGLPHSPQRWQVRSKLARWVRRLDELVDSDQVVDRINALVGAGDLDEHTLVEIIDLAAIELITEAKATAEHDPRSQATEGGSDSRDAKGSPQAAPRLALVGVARATRPGWWHDGPAPRIDWNAGPDAIDPDDVTAWVRAQITTTLVDHGTTHALRAGQKIAAAGRRTPWADLIALTTATIATDLAASSSRGA